MRFNYQSLNLPSLINKIPKQPSPQWLVIVAPARVIYMFLNPPIKKSTHRSAPQGTHPQGTTSFTQSQPSHLDRVLSWPRSGGVHSFIHSFTEALMLNAPHQLPNMNSSVTQTLVTSQTTQKKQELFCILRVKLRPCIQQEP